MKVIKGNSAAGLFVYLFIGKTQNRSVDLGTAWLDPGVIQTYRDSSFPFKHINAEPTV